MPELIYKDEVYDIVGAAMEVHSILGPGFLEAVYQEVFAMELRLRNIPFVEQPPLHLEYKGYRLERKYVPDYLCYEEIVIEIKALTKCGPNEEAQIINALKASKRKIGILINFSEPSLFWKRYVN